MSTLWRRSACRPRRECAEGDEAPELRGRDRGADAGAQRRVRCLRRRGSSRPLSHLSLAPRLANRGKMRGYWDDRKSPVMPRVFRGYVVLSILFAQAFGRLVNDLDPRPGVTGRFNSDPTAESRLVSDSQPPVFALPFRCLDQEVPSRGSQQLPPTRRYRENSPVG